MKHRGDKLHYKSAVLRDISSMFSLPGTQPNENVLQSSAALPPEHGSRLGNDVVEGSAGQPTKIKCVRVSAAAEVPDECEVSIKELSNKASELSSQIDSLVNSASEQNQSKQPVNNGLPSNVLDDEGKQSLINTPED